MAPEGDGHRSTSVPDDGSSARTRVDVFVSYAGPDRPWAEWAAQTLEAAGHVVLLDVWDWSPGDNVVLRMSEALERADRVLAVYSPAYFQPGRFTEHEWTPLVGLMTGEHRRLVPVRVAPVTPPMILQPLIYRDLFGLDEEQARAQLLSAFDDPAGRGADHPFPGAAAAPPAAAPPPVRLPGSQPALWEVPPRAAAFTGRTLLLADIRNRLTAGDRTAVVVLSGIGGVGKTTIATEYAYLFAGDYDLVWWLDAHRAELIAEEAEKLAVKAGWTEPGAAVSAVQRAVLENLRRSGRWLLVFDNVEEAEQLTPWLPSGNGHVLVTSRSRGFAGVAQILDVGVMSRQESVDLLQVATSGLGRDEAEPLADDLGDLPLALIQAAGLLTEYGMSAQEYREQLQVNAAGLLDESRAVHYPVSLAAGLQVTLDRLTEQDAAGFDLVHLLSVLAPAPVRPDWLRKAPAAALTPALAEVCGSVLPLRRMLSRLADLGLARITTAGIAMHRLTQAVLRDRRDPADRLADRERAIALLVAVESPLNGSDPASWPEYGHLVPHVIALDPATGPHPLRELACCIAWYQLMRGEYATALPHIQVWHRSWLDLLGPDDPDTLMATGRLARTLFYLERYEEAHELDDDRYRRCLELLGDRAPETLRSAHNLASSLRTLRRFQEAYDLDLRTHLTWVELKGDDSADALAAQNNLAHDLSGLGRLEESCDLQRVVLEKRRASVGPDHPDTLRTASNLAITLTDLGRPEEAHLLDAETLERRKATLGPEHPDTLTSALCLVFDLQQLSRVDEARTLAEELLPQQQRVLGTEHAETRTTEQLLISLRTGS